MSTRQPCQMPGKLRPAREAVFTGEGKLCLGERASAARLIGCVQVLRDSIDRAFDAVTYLGGRVRAVSVAGKRDVKIVQLHERLDPFRHPGAESVSVARHADLEEVLRALFVLLEVGTRRQRKCVRHTNLLSWNAWSPHDSG